MWSFSLWTCTSLCMSLLICVCVCAVLILWKNIPVQWHNFTLSKVEKMQSGLPLFLCVWGCGCCPVMAVLHCCSVPGLCSLAIRSAFIGPPFLWHSYLLEFWAFLFFVALQDDLGSLWIFSALAPKWVISTRVPLLENGIRNQICSGVLITVSLLSGNRLCRVIKYMHTY